MLIAAAAGRGGAVVSRLVPLISPPLQARIMYVVVEHKPARMYVTLRRTVMHAKHIVTPATNPS
jgi:hypothetical protein